MDDSEEAVIPDIELTPLGRRLILPGVTYFHRRAGTDSVAGVTCSAAVIAAGEALDVMLAQALPGGDDVDRNPFTRRASELTPTSMLRALRPASAHYFLTLFEDADDRRLLSDLLGLSEEEAIPRLFSIHAEVFELGRESQRALADYWARVGEHVRYSVGMWGLVTAAAFGVRHLQEDAALTFRSALDDRLPHFGRRLATSLQGVVVRERRRGLA